MELKFHKQVTESCIYCVWKYYIGCVTILKISIICYTILFSETPGSLHVLYKKKFSQGFYFREFRKWTRNREIKNSQKHRELP